MSIEQISQLVTVGQIALEQWRAQEAAANAQHAYHLAIQQYERRHGQLAARLRKDNPEHAAALEFTAPKYRELQKAKRRVYTVKVRLAKACAKLARLAAERAS